MAHRFSSSTPQPNTNFGTQNPNSPYFLLLLTGWLTIFPLDPLFNSQRSIISHHYKETHVSIIEPIYDNKQQVRKSILYDVIYCFI
jgi:hypothetical protein